MSTKRSFEAQMAMISNVLNGTLKNADILEAVTAFGYTKERIQNEGLAQHTQVQKLSIGKLMGYGEQYSASQQSSQLFDEAYASYIKILQLSRVALKNQPGALHSLRATGTRNRSLTGFISDARVLCNNLLVKGTYKQAVQAFGVTEAQLLQLLHQMNGLEAAHLAFLKGKGMAQSATLERDQAFDTLYNWYSDFRAVVRIALDNRPQLLEKLGITIKR